MAETAYIVLAEVDAQEKTWVEVGTYVRASADAAKQAAALEHGDGRYSATPARGWTPRKLKVAQRASFEDVA
jgi:hypothetical protein